MAVVVVLAMIAAAVFARQTADQHRHAEVIAEEIHAASQELSAFKWRANTELLAGKANFSYGSAVVADGARILTHLNSEAKQLAELEPGPGSERLEQDVERVTAGSLQMLSMAQQTRLPKRAMQETFQPLLDRVNSDAESTAAHEQSVAGGALELAWLGSIGSIVLGVGALAALGWRLSRVQRKTRLADEIRAIERRSEQRLRALFEQSSDVVTVLGRDLRVRWQAGSIKRVLGHEPGSLFESPITSIVHPDERLLFDGFLQAAVDGRGPSAIQARMRHADGRWCHVESSAENRFADPAIGGLVLTVRDVSERTAVEDELRHQSFHDALTGLANRALFENRLRHALAGTLRSRRELAVLLLDLDDFKTINDSLGHRTGDALLRRVASRIDSLVRPSDTAARLGGDEFAILVGEPITREDAEHLARRLLEAIGERLVLDGRELTVTASVGIALSEECVDADELLRNADTAMYAAKAGGKDSVHTFEPSMHSRVLDRLELRAELTQAVQRDELLLEYQPIVSLEAGGTVGFEALVRWQHPVRGRLGPDQFIGLAEETGVIVPIGRWVLERACVQLHQWQLALPDPRPLYVSVNVSIRQLREQSFPMSVAEILERTGLPPESLVLEITEGLLADESDAIVTRLGELKALGLRIAIDDFGTGYSGLSHLQQFPIDILKIDKSFIDELHLDPQKASLVSGIVNLGESLDLEVIAEGIEEQQQAERLRAMRSPLGQGFLFSRPLAVDQVEALLELGASRRAA